MLSILLNTLSALPQFSSEKSGIAGVDHALVATTNLSAAR